MTAPRMTAPMPGNTAPATSPTDDERSARRSQLTSDSGPNPARTAEEVIVATRRVACDGVGGALGHPRVYLELGVDGVVECSYCDRRFVIAGQERQESERLAPGVYEGSGGH